MRTAQGSLKEFEILAKFDLISRKQNEVYEFYEHFRAKENVWTIFAKLRNNRRKSQHLLIFEGGRSGNGRKFADLPEM
jgi:hypothetical protein